MLLIRCRIGVALIGDGAPSALGVSTMTICGWLAEGLLPAEQTFEHGSWRFRLTDEIRQRFVPTVPDGYVKLDEAARQLGAARQTVLNQVRAGRRKAVMVVEGNGAGCASRSIPASKGYLSKPRPWRHAPSWRPRDGFRIRPQAAA